MIKLILEIEEELEVNAKDIQATLINIDIEEKRKNATRKEKQASNLLKSKMKAQINEFPINDILDYIENHTPRID